MMQQIFAVGEKSITNKSITNYELKNDELDTAKTRNSSFVIPNYIRFKPVRQTGMIMQGNRF